MNHITLNAAIMSFAFSGMLAPHRSADVTLCDTLQAAPTRRLWKWAHFGRAAGGRIVSGVK